MSAYVVDRFHISAILMFTCTGRPGREAREILEAQGQQLLDENVRSVRVRYPRETPPTSFSYWIPTCADSRPWKCSS